MARNRQRAKARKQKVRRENVPGSLDSASGEVERVEAGIVAGAGAEPRPLDDNFDSDAGRDDAALDREQVAPGAGNVSSSLSARKPSGLRLVNFAHACVAELQRVQWPDRRQTGQATAVVLGFVVIAGAFLGLADAVAQRIIDFII
jgi:preprotein translocase subunit SecE